MAPKQSLNAFLARYDPAVERMAREALRILRKLLPGAFELVHDNYTVLGIGFSSTDRPANIVLSLVLHPREVRLFFFDGVSLPDPTWRLTGTGIRLRHLVLERGAATLNEPDVRNLIRQAAAQANPPFRPGKPGRIVIRSISARRMERRPRPFGPRSGEGRPRREKDRPRINEPV